MKAIEPLQAAQHPMAVRGFDRLLTTQRPVVLAHVRSIRRHNPGASPEQVIRILERRYLAAVTTGGAGVGATAVIPGVGTMVSLALTGVETAGFLEASALFAQSVTEIHGIAVTDPDRARTIVMAMMLGTSGADLVRNLAAQATGEGVARTKFWGNVIGRNVPQAFMGQIADRMKKAFIQRFARNTTTGALGRIMPFGIGAVIGGTGNHMLGRKVINSSREAFGAAPAEFPPNLEPRMREARVREPHIREPGEAITLRERMTGLAQLPGRATVSGLAKLRRSGLRAGEVSTSSTSGSSSTSGTGEVSIRPRAAYSTSEPGEPGEVSTSSTSETGEAP